MAAKSVLNAAKSPMGHFLWSSALSAVRIAAISKSLPEMEALRLSLFDAKARELVGDGRIWELKSQSLGIQARGNRKIIESEDDSDDEDFDSDDDFDDDDDDLDELVDEDDDDDDEDDKVEKKKKR